MCRDQELPLAAVRAGPADRGAATFLDGEGEDAWQESAPRAVDAGPRCVARPAALCCLLHNITVPALDALRLPYPRASVGSFPQAPTRRTSRTPALPSCRASRHRPSAPPRIPALLHQETCPVSTG